MQSTYLDLNKWVPDLPSVRRFSEQIISDLRDGRSVIVLLPAGIEQEWTLQRVRKDLFDMGIYYQEITVVSKDANSQCAQHIAESLGISDEHGYYPETPQGLLKSEGLPNVILLNADYAYETQFSRQWLIFFEEWARLNHQLVNSGGRQTALLIILSAESIPNKVPDSDLYLSVRFWWGLPSLLETRLLCRQYSDFGRSNDFITLWPEFVCTAVAAGDLKLLRHLWENLGSSQTINEQIYLYAKDLKWGNEDLKKIDELLNGQFKNGRFSFENPPKLLMKPWAKGIITYIPERGICLQTAALALLGLWDDAYHRIWTGQTELLMPMIDSFRLQVCDYLTKRFGKSWPTSWIQPSSDDEIAAVRENPRSCQWGHLSKIFDTVPKLKRLKNITKSVKFARHIRNELAHFRPIKERDFLRLSELFGGVEF